MAISWQKVYNRALDIVGDVRLIEIGLDNGATANWFKNSGKPIIQDFLREMKPGCAITRTPGTGIASGGSPGFEYVYQYPFPPDCLRVLEVWTGGTTGSVIADESKWITESRKVLTNIAGPIHLKYVWEVNPTILDATTAEAISARLAFELCFSRTNNVQLMSTLKQILDEKLAKLANIDSDESKRTQGKQPFQATGWADHR